MTYTVYNMYVCTMVFAPNRTSGYSESEEREQMKIPQADVSQGLSTTTFEITGKATIPSDNASHKVINL